MKWDERKKERKQQNRINQIKLKIPLCCIPGFGFGALIVGVLNLVGVGAAQDNKDIGSADYLKKEKRMIIKNIK